MARRRMEKQLTQKLKVSDEVCEMVNPVDRSSSQWLAETIMQIVGKMGPFSKERVEELEFQLILRACSTLLEDGKVE